MNVGDYVRTDTGQIGKITYFEGDMVRVDCDKFITYKNNHNEITKISPNIIDLIEVGDFVNFENINGGYVLNKKEDSVDTWSILPNNLKNNDIKSVITREQMKSIEYNVGEE